MILSSQDHMAFLKHYNSLSAKGYSPKEYYNLDIRIGKRNQLRRLQFDIARILIMLSSSGHLVLGKGLLNDNKNCCHQKLKGISSVLTNLKDYTTIDYCMIIVRLL